MKHFCLTDWVTIRGLTTLTATITQGEPAWIDVGEHEDAVFYLQVQEVTGTVTLTYQTSPSKDDVSFQPLFPGFAMVTGTRAPDRVLGKYSLVPIARYVRWQLIGGGTSPYDATFRIWVGAF
jgi:hypothetical protein